MQFFFILFSLIAVALAQRISIGAPSAGQALTAGQNTTVSVVKGDTLTGSTEIGIGITLHHCSQTLCEDANEILGSILYAGPFNPQRGSGNQGQPYQNFTITVPDGFSTGPAVVSIAHASFVGAGPFFFTEIANVTVNVA